MQDNYLFFILFSADCISKYLIYNKEIVCVDRVFINSTILIFKTLTLKSPLATVLLFYTR